jgi:hypothetical protein
VFLSFFRYLKEKEAFLEVLSIKGQFQEKLSEIDHNTTRVKHIFGRIERRLVLEFTILGSSALVAPSCIRSHFYTRK